MKINFRYLLIFLVSFYVYQQAAAQAVSFSPTRVFFKGNPGETVSEVITISNTSKLPYEFVTSIADWKRDSVGQKEYAEMGTMPHSNAKHIQLSGTTLQVNPGEQKSFTVSMIIPVNPSSSIASNSMLFFTQTNAQEPDMDGKSGVGVKVSMELGVQLFYTPYDSKPGDLHFLAFEKDETISDDNALNSRNIRLAVKFQNTGEVNKDGFVRFELTNKQSGDEVKAKPIPIAIMPHDEQWVYYTLPHPIDEGEYLAVAILDAGNNFDLKVAEKNIHVQ